MRWSVFAIVLVLSACTARTDVTPGAGIPNEPPPVVSSPLPVEPVALAAPEPAGTEVVFTDGRFFRPFDAPQGDRLERVWAINSWYQPVALPVLKRRADAEGQTWLRVLLPVRPNGSRGWIREHAVTSRHVDERIVVDLSDRILRRWRGGELVDVLRVGIGTPATPTATGSFFVWARVSYEDPSGPYGNFALGLSGFSDVITQWAGGGRMAIHGTADAHDRGRQVSHGCVRVYNGDMHRLTDVPMGTPVTIRP
jgi:hypothetical protein